MNLPLQYMIHTNLYNFINNYKTMNQKFESNEFDFWNKFISTIKIPQKGIVNLKSLNIVYNNT